MIENIPKPKEVKIDNIRLLLGEPTTLEQKIANLSPNQYEEFIKCWIYGYLDNNYKKVRKMGASADKGRDIIGIVEESNNNDFVWDNFQCKHYKDALSPSKIWTEIGKIIYYTYIEDYPIPRKYYFVAPKGVGNDLFDLLQNEDELRAQLKQNWSSKCESGITTKKVPLDNKLEEYIDEFDFSIFTDLDPTELINQLKGTKYYIQWFGGGITKPRPLSEKPTNEIQTHELVYINQLLLAYGDHHGETIEDIDKLKEYKKESEHFERQRVSFYESESLQKYVRETLNEDLFIDLQEELYDGLIDIVDDDDYALGYDCLKETLKESGRLDLSGLELITAKIVKQKDRHGICHQLVNKERFKWVE